MNAAVFLLSLIIVLLIAGALPHSGVNPNILFQSPWFILLMALLCVHCVLCAARRLGRPNWRSIPFAVTHLGVALILVGAALTYRYKVGSCFHIPVGQEYKANAVPVADGRREVGFEFCVSKFEVERYDPDYNLYRIQENNDDAPGAQPDYQFIDSYPVRDGDLELEPLDTTVPLQDLKTPDGQWVQVHHLDPNHILHRQAKDKAYIATFEIFPTEGETVKTDFSTNKPARHGGWSFYLMDYDHQTERQVVLEAKRDPGRLPVLGGLWTLLAGTAVLCLWRQRETEIPHGN